MCHLFWPFMHAIHVFRIVYVVTKVVALSFVTPPLKNSIICKFYIKNIEYTYHVYSICIFAQSSLFNIEIIILIIKLFHIVSNGLLVCVCQRTKWMPHSQLQSQCDLNYWYYDIFIVISFSILNNNNDIILVALQAIRVVFCQTSKGGKRRRSLVWFFFNS